MFTLPAYPAPIPSACASQVEWQQDPWAATSSSYSYSLFRDGKPVQIVFSPKLCLGLLLLELDPAGRYDSLNHGIDVPLLEGAAALTYEHEIGHAKLATQDETAAECYGMAHYPDLLANVPAARRVLIERSAFNLDASAPLPYHTRPC
jgi:hypothetical protein